MAFGASYSLEFGSEGAAKARVDLGAEPVKSGRNDRNCYSVTLSSPLAVPSAGEVRVSAGSRDAAIIRYTLAGGGGQTWSQLNSASEERVVQLRWRCGSDGLAILERAVLQVRPSSDSLPGAERARVLAL